MNIPSFETYGEYKSNGYGAHALRFYTPHGSVWFSYHTPVAFYTNKTGLVIRENSWGPTTGKHLNWIDPDKSKRISGEDFQKRLAAAFA